MARIIWLAVAGMVVGQPLAAGAQRLPTTLGQAVAEQGPVVALVQTFITAQHDFDLPKIKALTSDDYVEISPLGEVDPRDKMLGFYAPEKKTSAPAMTIGDSRVTMVGDGAATVLTSVSYEVAPTGQPSRTVSLRVVFVARREGRDWKLVSAQYTPIRSKS